MGRFMPCNGVGARAQTIIRLKKPYAAQLKKQITIRLDEESINYFKAISQNAGIPYQSLINLYLRDCAVSHRKLNLNWS